MTIPKGNQFYDTFAKAKPFESTRRQLFEQKVDKDEPKKPFEFLNELTSEQLIALVASEDSRVVAIALAQLEGEKRTAILNRLDEAQKRDVLLSIGNLNDVPLEAVVQIAKKLNVNFVLAL